MAPVDSREGCPVCDRPYDSVSEHADGLLVNLLDNDRYRRVCFEPVLADDGGSPEARVRFYHHTHDQTATTRSDDGDDADPVARDRE